MDTVKAGKREKIRMILTCSRGVVNYGRVEALKSNPVYDFYIVGIDVLGDGYKLPQLDEQMRAPHGHDKDYVRELLKIARAKKIDVILPTSDIEIYTLSKHKELFEKEGIAIVSSPFDVIARSVNKALMLDFLKSKHVDVPKYAVPKNASDFIASAKKLGYPKKMLVVKPADFGSGNRGVWYLKEDFSKELLSVRSISYSTLGGYVSQLRRIKKFPSLVLMEYLGGEEYSVDGLSEKGRPVYVLPRVRVSPLPGYSQEALIHRNNEVLRYVESICRAFGFDSIFNVQLKYDGNGKPKVYEINPRASATASANAAAGVDLVLFSILQALGKKYPKHIRFSPVRMVRYWKEFYTSARS